MSTSNLFWLLHDQMPPQIVLCFLRKRKHTIVDSFMQAHLQAFGALDALSHALIFLNDFDRLLFGHLRYQAASVCIISHTACHAVLLQCLVENVALLLLLQSTA